MADLDLSTIEKKRAESMLIDGGIARNRNSIRPGNNSVMTGYIKNNLPAAMPAV